nr:phospholipase A and acyltransferase 3 isoform X2 [Nothobranchius furzeri]
MMGGEGSVVSGPGRDRLMNPVITRVPPACKAAGILLGDKSTDTNKRRASVNSSSMGMKNSHPKLFPGDIVEYPRNKYFSHFGIYFGERDGVPYVAHLTCRDSDTQIPLFGRALRSEVKLDPLEFLGDNFKVKNMLDGTHAPRDFHTVVKPAIEDMIGREVTFDILFHNSEHQATLFRYGVKKSQQIEKIYEHILPAWKKLFEEKKL